MRNLRKLSGMLLFAGWFAAMFVASSMASARVATAGASAGSLQDDSTSAVACVDRPKGLSAPPKRLAPVPHARDRKKDDDDDKDEAKQTAKANTSRLGFKAVCPQGKVPVVKTTPTKPLKGNPLFASDPGREYLKYEGRALGDFVLKHMRSFEEVYGRPKGETEKAPAPAGGPAPTGGQCGGMAWNGGCFYYGSAGFITTADGGGMTQSIEKPVYVNTGGEGHSLNEVAVQGGNKYGNIVEIGWIVDSEMEGNANPHIFVFHWINGVKTCYDTCAWHQWSNTYSPGMDLGSAIGKKVYIGYVFYQGNWWAWFDDQWMGYFPGSEWNGQFTKASVVQWFGEVESENGIPPQTQMGNGQFPSSTSAASMETLCDVDAVAWVCWYRDKQKLQATVTKYYDISRVGFGAARYGGPGQ